MKTYAFLTRKNFRVEVEASTPISAWHKLRSIPHLKEEVLPTYQEYSKNGLASVCDWRALFDELSEEERSKYYETSY